MFKLPIRILVLIFLCGWSQTAHAGERIYLSGIDAATAVPWEFHISTGRNSNFWTTIPVPSNWEMQGFGYYTYGDDYADYQANPEIGSYRHRFRLRDIAGKRYRLTFQGAMTDTRVTINGKPAGSVHRGGFMQFSYEITGLVQEGENLIEVEVRKSSENESIQNAERHADFWLFGGIYRPVYIDVLPQEFVERVAIDAGMDGRFNMDVYLNGISESRRLVARIYASDGAQMGRPMEVDISSGKSFARLHDSFSEVVPWSHEFPHRYRVEVSLLAGARVLHSFNQTFGFRTFEVRDHDGFYLNGKRILLKGANMHSIRPGTGRALSRADMVENIRVMKDLNFNAVRPCHYPPDEYFFTLCDSLGLLAMDELTGWHSPLDKREGGRLVKEMIARDVNHPSIILWGNGNHRAHNPDLDEDFFRWDIQQRRPLKNAPKNDEIFDDYYPEFDIVNTTFYPSWEQLTERLNGSHIVLPNETVHALYDGGGAASLSDYWNAFKKSPVGGGIMIWALFDEGVVRTDQGNRIDCQGNKAPDGIAGLQGEKEGSYDAVREIWSPVQIDLHELPATFDGTIPVANEFTFVNLNQCRFEWKLLNFTGVSEAKAGHRTIFSGTTESGNIPAGAEGTLRISLPDEWNDCDALELTAFDHTGKDVYTWRWPVASRGRLSINAITSGKTGVSRDATNPFVIHAGGTSYRFNNRTGVLEEIKASDGVLPVKNTPYIVAESVDGVVKPGSGQGTVTVKTDGDNIKVESSGANGFDSFTWTIVPDGSLTLDYAFTLPDGEYYYAGIGLEVPADQVTGKRWLGEGPSRIWKNRTEGGLLDVWDVEKHEQVPGVMWNYPEFEGFFAPWYWAMFRLSGDHQIGLSTNDDHLVLGVLNPVNGEDPKFAAWHYPEKEGLYLFHCISGIGAKWKPAEDFGPSGKPSNITQSCAGSVRLSFDRNTMETQIKRFKLEIE